MKDRRKVKCKMKRFAATFEFGRPNLYKVNIVKESDKTFTIDDADQILGYIFFPTRIKKNYIKIFEHPSEAIVFLINKSEEHTHKLKQQLEEQFDIHKKLVDLLREVNDKKK